MKTALLLASLLAFASGGVACAATDSAAVVKEAQVAPAKPVRVLAFSETKGFRHAKQIQLGHAMLKDFAKDGAITLDAHSGEDGNVFNDEVLKNVDVIVFLNTTDNGKVPLLGEKERAAFEAFIKRGGGWVGVHGASDAGRQWPFYTEMVGCHFKCHPAQQTADLIVVDPNHPSTAHMEKTMKHHEEWYSFDANIHGNPKYHELLRVDEKSYKTPGNGVMGADHPICWCREIESGRAWYTELGHTEQQYKEAWFRKHVLGGIEWAAHRGPKAK